VNTDKAIANLKEICSRQEKCISDAKKKMDLWEVPPDKQDVIINELCSEKFIDERRFSKFFVNDKFRFNKWGKTKIRYVLKEKGIKNEDINSALDNISNTEYSQTLFNILSKKLAALKGTEYYKKKASLIRFGQSRGYESEIIYSVCEQLLSKE